MNNAGILEKGSIEETSLSQYDRVMNANVRYILCFRIGIRHGTAFSCMITALVACLLDGSLALRDILSALYLS